MAHNRRAFELYQRMGYAVEGRRRECLIEGGRLADELYMAKLLNTELNTEGHAEDGTRYPGR
jgi:ribosomal protein S18 acetylase RimI-like enzyme